MTGQRGGGGELRSRPTAGLRGRLEARIVRHGFAEVIEIELSRGVGGRMG